MNKYIAAKAQWVYHLYIIILPIFMIVCIIIAVIHVVHQKEEGALFFICYTILFAWSVLVLIIGVWKYLDDPILGKFSFDVNGITFYTPLRTITFLYDECAEIGFTRWIGGTVIKQNYIYYIYLSKRTLTEEQRLNLFLGRSKKKRGNRHMPLYQSEYVLFQYRSDIFSSFVECVPERFKQGLIFTEKHLNLKAFKRS